MRLPPTPGPLRQDLAATPVEIPLEMHLRSLILKNNPPIPNSQLSNSSRPSNIDSMNAASPANLPALLPKGPGVQRNDDPTTQGMAYRDRRSEDPQPQQNRLAQNPRANRAQKTQNLTGQVAPAAYSFTPPPSGLHERKTYDRRTDRPNNYYRQGRGPPQTHQMNCSNDRPRQQFQGRGENPNRQLYDHHTDGTYQHHRHGRGGIQIRRSNNPARDQVNYLQQLAIVEVPKAEMNSEEYTKRENLRLHLERLCRETIYNFELKKDKDFDANTVQLKCFGSLSSGFATRSSDMDLALLSPYSVPGSSSRDSEIPRLLEKAFLDLGYGARLLTRTRVPIIKFCEEPTPDLAKSLLDERQKYEQEREAPPKPKPEKVDKEKKRGRKRKNTEDGAKEGSKDCAKDSSKGSSQATIVSKNQGMTTVTIRAEESVGSEVNETTVTLAKEDYPMDDPTSRSETPPVINNEFDDLTKDNGSPPAGSPLMETTISGKKVTADDPVNTEENDNSTTVGSAGSLTEEREAKGKAKVQPKDAMVAMVKKDEAEEEDKVVRTDDELVFLYTLAMDEGWYDAEERKIIKDFVTAVKLQASGAEAASLDQARLKLKDLTKILHRYRAPTEHHLDFPKTGVGVQCDINFSNPLALHNTLLLRCYSHCDPRVQPMIIFVKAWAKKRKINSPYHGTLSSYGYVLMVLHFLINIADPPVLPNLQLIQKAAEDPSPDNDEIIDGYTVRFWRSENEIIDLARSGHLAHNTRDNVGSLLRGFFHYYTQQGYYSPHGGFCWAKDIISIRTNTGILPKTEKGWTEAKTITIEPTGADGDAREIKQRYLLAIEDPFETDHNIARTVVYHGLRAIRDEFQRAHGIVQNVGHRAPVIDLFAEAPDRESLNRRFFGPLPRKEYPEKKDNNKPKARNSSKGKKSGLGNEKLGSEDSDKGNKGGVGNDKEWSSGDQKSFSGRSTDKSTAGAAPQEKEPGNVKPSEGPRKPRGPQQPKEDQLPIGEESKQPNNKLPPHLRMPLEGSSAQEQKPAPHLGVPAGESSVALPHLGSVSPLRHDLNSANQASPYTIEGQASAVNQSLADTTARSTTSPVCHDSINPSSLEISSITNPNTRIRTNLSHVYFFENGGLLLS